MPFFNGSIAIAHPPDGAQLVVGQGLVVEGTTNPRIFVKPNSDITNTIPPTSVAIRIDGAPPETAKSFDAEWEQWSWTRRVTDLGQHTIVAIASWPNNYRAEARITVTVVAAPLDLVLPGGPVTTVSFPVTVAASHPNGIVPGSVLAGADGQPSTQLSPAGDRWVGQLRLGSDRVPGDGRSVPVELQAQSGDGAVHRRTVQIRAVDATAPTIDDFTPADGAKLTGSAVGVEVDVRITARDPEGPHLTSGLAGVDVQLDGVSTAAGPTPDPSLWTARVFVPGADDHVLTVRARDAAGRWSSPPISHRVVVTAPTDVRDLGRQTYLRDLLTFATERLWTRPVASGAPEPPFVTEGQLAEALGQDVSTVARLGVTDAEASVRTLRLVVEALGGHLRPGPPAPLAAWGLHEGNGATEVADTASGRAVGTVVGATWVPEDPPVLRFDPAASARVQVRAQASAQVRVRDEITMVARIRPSADTAQAGIIVNKEGEYEFARFPDGSLQWALATTTPGWNWVDTGVIVPVGQWAHVAVAYDGERVRTWVDGVLRHTAAATGPVGDVGPGLDELWIGGRAAVPQYFAGDIADVAVFGRALGEAEIHRLLGRSDDADGSRLWVEDELPAGAVTDVEADAWSWIDGVDEDPDPSSGSRCHRSEIAAGRHQHLFRTADTGFPVDRGDVLVTDVWLDPSNPPRQVMLQWRDDDGSWEHRAYWGQDLIAWGIEGTPARRRIGDLPPGGAWVTLRVPARLVGLEGRTVHGVGYVLFDGRAAWDRTGRITARAAAARSGHTQEAYAALLRANGTSEIELRLARGAPQAQRVALAQRLGITLSTSRPDELDELLLAPGELDAAALTSVFGYADPLERAPALRPVAALTRWRLATLRDGWRRADRGAPGAVGQRALLDPEVLVPGDIGDRAGAAWALLAERIAWRESQLTALTAVRASAADDAEAVASAFGTVLAGVDLDQLLAARRAGQDVSAGLTAGGLSEFDLLRLAQLRALAADGPLRDDEWADLVTALVRVLRRRNWPGWLAAEATADVVLDPAVFRDSAGADASGLPAFIDATARRDWLDRLAARGLAVESVAAGEAAARDRADDAALPRIRDALLATVDPGIPGLSVADALSSVLFVDVGAGAEDVTSRVGQAIEALQGVMFAARTGRLAPQGPWPPAGPARSWVLRETADYPRADFDDEWRWMGAFAAWRAAVSVFFRPELMLYPTLRPGTSPSFTELLRALAGAGSDLSPQLARQQAAAFGARLDQATRAALDGVAVGDRPLGELVLTDQLSPDGLAALAQGERQLLGPTTTLGQIPVGLQEVLWLVPLQLAVSLFRVGEHLAALDWLRTLYAYDQGGADRIVFHGFRLESADAGGLQRPLNWLLGEELNPHRIAAGRAAAHLRFTLLQLAGALVEHADTEFTADTQESRPRARELYLAAARSLRLPEFDDPADAPRVPANPVLQALRGRVAANLGKLRRGLTIAGVPRPALAAYEGSATTLVLPSGDGTPLAPPGRSPQPTPYRYSTLLARAQQLVALAAQVESSYLSALAGADAEGYTEQRAGNDLALARARTAVQQAAAEAADAEVTVSQAQALRARRHAESLEGLIAGGESTWERRLLESYEDIRSWRTLVAFTDAAVTVASAAASATNPWGTAAVFGAAGGRYLASAVLADAEARSQEAATRASFERRTQEWQLQASLARGDEAIAALQTGVMRRRAEIAAQERIVAETEESHAHAAVSYLAGRRLTGEMYAWMANQLGEVYRYLLRQATSVAQAAQQQLAFERQQPPPEIIQPNYWTAVGTGGQGQEQPDRRGLTGSARLLRDLTELDQHAFETNRRKLNLEHVFPLSRTAPEAFAEFRRTGVLPFATPLEAFDRRFPGHFLRTVRRVRVTFVALVPPSQGIAATLTCSGQSRIVVGQYGVFQPLTLTRAPETVAYSSPAAATGVFDLDPQPELKFFFEDHGVDTTWELRLPKAANPLDYRTIAEILVTVDYTALSDADYGRQVRTALPRRMRGTVPLSIREDFPDAWYALVEGDPADPAVVAPVELPVPRSRFPRNVEDVRLEAISLLVVRPETSDVVAADPAVDHLDLVRGKWRLRGGAATPVGGVISTRLATGTRWLPLLDPPDQVAGDGRVLIRWDKEPIGTWELGLADDPDTRQALRSGAIDDLVLVLSYRAELPAWPA